ncbi:hypothetical protein CO046_01500 [Candidatus Peregrinibacteria bacterium CG_4_9_14_0_2_um_filter_53_11]|nr:MAG: hypothetical protein CO046_01500 [Candidatus Peregrinibacteria bacterium CG_4_9_14_0_2_um_filter_53_11]
MFKLFRRSSPTEKDTFLVLDIGTDTVKALVCQAQEQRIIVHGASKVAQTIGDMQSGAVMDIGSVIENASRAIDEATRQAEHYPEDVVIGIAGELVKGMTHRSIHIRKEPHAKIDLSELKHIIHKIQWKSFEETRSQLAYETGYNEIDVKLVNAAIVDVQIDGYRVGNPIGFQGKEVAISIFNAFAPLVHYGALQTIAAELGLNLMSITAEPYALSRILDHTDRPTLNAIFIDIGAGTTDIAVVNNSSLEGTKMFTIGGRTFTKRLATTLSISMAEAEEIKRAYSAGKLEKQSEKIVREAMEADADVWLSGVSFALSEFHQLDQLPSAIYLCGGSVHLPELKNALQSTDWTADLPFNAPPTINLLQPRQVTYVHDETRSLNEPEDITPLALARIGIEFLGEEHLTGKLLKKVIRLMQL